MIGGVSIEAKIALGWCIRRNRRANRVGVPGVGEPALLQGRGIGSLRKGLSERGLSTLILETMGGRQVEWGTLSSAPSGHF